jgi:uroporphyrinogen decarboxylase
MENAAMDFSSSNQQSNGLANSPLVRALSGEVVQQAPVWFMRQAGRFLPEYREIRAKHSMLDVIRTAELAAEVTMQPIRRFAPDAGIIFADILNPLIGMGAKLDFVAGGGPKIFNPVRTSDDVDALIVPETEANVGYTLEAIRMVVGQLKQSNTPLFGFAGAPFTLSSYLIEGESSSKLHNTKRFMWQQSEAWHRLQSKLADMLVSYLLAQAKAGVSALQLFDSWLGILGPSEYAEFVEPYIIDIIQRVKQECSLPFVFFATGCAGLFERFSHLGADVLGVDWRMTLPEAAKLSGGRVALQGNLDPTVLAFSSPEYLTKEVGRILTERKQLCDRGVGHVFNLGHGIIPETPISQVELVMKLLPCGARKCSELCICLFVVCLACLSACRTS